MYAYIYTLIIAKKENEIVDKGKFYSWNQHIIIKQ